MLEKLSNEFGFKVSKYKKYKNFLDELEQDQHIYGGRTDSAYFDYIENLIQDDYKKVLDLISSHNEISEQYELLREKQSVFEKSLGLISPRSDNMIEQGSLNFLAGAVNVNEEIKMKKMIFRASRGRAIINFFDFVQSTSNYIINTKEEENLKVTKKIYTIFFQGGEEKVLLSKILNICNVLGASRYSIPENVNKDEIISNLKHQMDEKQRILSETLNSIKVFLKEKTENVDCYNLGSKL